VKVAGHGAGALVGRDRELEVLGSFLDRAMTSGAALWVVGEPGVGRSALLAAAADAAAAGGALTLVAAGVEFEADLAFSALHQALAPVLEELEPLPTRQRSALLRAVGTEAGPAPDRLAVSAATMALLGRLAHARPVLVVVDDLQWVDRASAEVFGFVARRAEGIRVGVLGASRTPVDGSLVTEDLPTFELGPLDDAAAESLLAARFPGLADDARDRLLADAEGNPLALLELAAALAGTQGLPAVLPLGRRLEALYASRVRDLPEPTRRALLLAALEGTGDMRTLRAAWPGGVLDDLVPAQRAGLVHIDDRAGKLVFRHPLVRATVVGVSSDGEQRAAHRVLADALADQPDRRAFHLAEATVQRDEHIAGLLDEAGWRAHRRGDAQAAVAALLRAAELGAHGADRSRRLAEAAYVEASVAGDLGDAPRLLSDARQADPRQEGSLHAAIATAWVLANGDGDIGDAHRVLAEAIAAHASRHGTDDDAFTEAVFVLGVLSWFGGRPELWGPFTAALARWLPRPPVLVEVFGALFADPARATPGRVAQLDALIATIHEQTDPHTSVRLGQCGLYTDRVAGCREAHWRVVRAGRSGGAVTLTIKAYINLCVDDYFSGAWDDGWALADEGIALCDSHGYALLTTPMRTVKALIAAARGDAGTARALAADLDRWAARRGARQVHSFASLARGVAALGSGDFDDAYDQLSEVSPAGSLPPYAPNALWAAPYLVEAMVRTNRWAEAAAHAEAMQRAGLAQLSSRLALVTLTCRALARPDDGTALFEEALSVPGAERWQFDMARAQLAYGERLRRVRAITGARQQLRAALGTAEGLGAAPWADRAANELRATHETRARPALASPEPLSLTAQEWEIAQLAASGFTNKEIGERLFLSHRTVGTHLYRIFPKLGITSRAALRDALTTHKPPE
jgi:DNA-binding CsgD family transcriptional regulator